MGENKNSFWQAIRGICIIAVVLIHCESMTELSLCSWESIYYLFIRNVINFPVAIFLFLSGYFDKAPKSLSNENVLSYYQKRLKKLVFPYMFYSTNYMLFKMCFGGTITLKSALITFATGSAATPFYYVLVLISFTLIAPFLHKCAESKSGSIAILLITPFLSIIAYCAQYNQIEVWSYLKYTPIWLAFFFGGILMQIKKPDLSIKKFLAVLPFAFALQVLETILYSGNSKLTAMSYSQMRISGFLYAAVIIGVFYVLSKQVIKIPSIIVGVGNGTSTLFRTDF